MEKSHKNIEVGYGVAEGLPSFEAGRKAASEAVSYISEHALSAILVFASVSYDLEEVLRGIGSVAAEATVFGATTAGEICNGMHENSVVAVALASPFIKVRCGVGRNVSGDWQSALNEAIDAPSVRPFFQYSAELWQDLIRKGKNVFAMVFSPGNTRHNDSRSYEIIDMLNVKSLGRLPVIGGAAADDWKMEANYVLLGRKAYPDSVLVAIFETQLKFGIALAHGFRATNHKAMVTSVDNHEVITLDGLPAADVYARLIGSSREALEGKHLTLTTGFTVGTSDPMGQYSVNVASYFTERGGVRLTQPVPAGSILTVMEPGSEGMVEAGRSVLRKAILRGRITDPALALVYYCALRPRIVGDKSKEEFSGMLDMMAGRPLAGFCSFGEQGLADDGVSRHNNSGISALILGSDLSQAAYVALENEKLREEAIGRARELDNANRELREALNKVKQLSGMLPICAHCKKVRNDKGFWDNIEKYIREHSEAEFTHSICPECLKKFHPEVSEKSKE